MDLLTSLIKSHETEEENISEIKRNVEYDIVWRDSTKN